MVKKLLCIALISVECMESKIGGLPFPCSSAAFDIVVVLCRSALWPRTESSTVTVFQTPTGFRAHIKTILIMSGELVVWPWYL